jgi:hypothetical protein
MPHYLLSQRHRCRTTYFHSAIDATLLTFTAPSMPHYLLSQRHRCRTTYFHSAIDAALLTFTAPSMPHYLLSQRHRCHTTYFHGHRFDTLVSYSCHSPATARVTLPLQGMLQFFKGKDDLPLFKRVCSHPYPTLLIPFSLVYPITRLPSLQCTHVRSAQLRALRTPSYAAHNHTLTSDHGQQVKLYALPSLARTHGTRSPGSPPFFVLCSTPSMHTLARPIAPHPRPCYPCRHRGLRGTARWTAMRSASCINTLKKRETQVLTDPNPRTP